MKQHETVKVGVKGLEVIRFVHRVVILDERRDLHVVADAVLNNAAKWIRGCALGQRKLVVSVRHAFWPNEDQVKGATVEEVLQLDPHRAGKGRLRPGTEDEYSDCRRSRSEALDA